MELKYIATRGFALGAKYGVVDGFRKFNSDEATPEMNESAAEGAIGIIIAVGGVLVALYIIAVVVGSISYSIGAIGVTTFAKPNSTWNATMQNMDSSAQGTFGLANILPIAIIGIGIMMIVIGAFSGPGI